MSDPKLDGQAAEETRRRFMREAIAEGRRSLDEGGGPFGALVVHRGEIVGRGTNRVTGSNDPTAHAEIVAIRQACASLGRFRLDGCEIYTTCEPCPMCLGAIYWARPDRFWYASTRRDAASAGFDDDLIYAEIALPPEARRVAGTGMMREQAKTLFDTWLAKKDRIPY